MADHEHFKVKDIIVTLKECGGFFSVAAKKLGCNYVTLCHYRDKYPEIKEALHAIRESQIDFTEGKLLANIKEKKEASIFFYLKTQAKHRGYIEKQQIEHSGMINWAENILDALPTELRNEVIQSLKDVTQSE